MKKKRSRKTVGDSQTRTVFYVILHGLITLIDIGDEGFIGYVLEMGETHKYLYGDWLDEDDIPARAAGEDPGRAVLLGVEEDGDDDLDDQQNAILSLASLPVSIYPSVRAMIYLPRPFQIYQRLQGKIEDDALSGSLGDLTNTPTHISGIRVFEYDVKDEEEVRLVFDNGNVWQCTFPFAEITKLSLKVGVLHIYNEPHQLLSPDTSHNRGEFNASAKFLGSDILFGKKTLFPKEDEPIPGILPGELRPLSQRGNSVLGMLYKARGSTTPVNDTGNGPGQVCGGLNAVLKSITS